MCGPGNPGIAEVARCVPVSVGDPAAILAVAERERADLTVVGPEAALERGVADRFGETGRPLVGPTQACAALETSKAFAKDFMARTGIPTARFRVCDRLDTALEAVSGGEFGFPVVIKADGLAAGKGVVIAGSREEAEAAVRAAMVAHRFGAAGRTLVIEECLSGPEVSFFVLADGEFALPLATAQDHKRLLDGDRGPNTGGMGAFAPSPLLTPADEFNVLQTIVHPVLAGMRRAGHRYRGFLYASLMLTADGPKVIEFNVRLGDPEAQVVLPLLDGPLARALYASATLGLNQCRLATSPDRLVGVVLASAGYPGESQTGRVIDGLDRAARRPDVLVFQAATRLGESHAVETAGGRVLTIVGRGADYEAAMATAYDAIGDIRFDGMQYRRDIGARAVGSPGATRL